MSESVSQSVSQSVSLTFHQQWHEGDGWRQHFGNGDSVGTVVAGRVHHKLEVGERLLELTRQLL